MAPIALAALLAMPAASCMMSRPTATPEIRVRHLPPDAQDIIEALLRSESVPLTVHPSCTGAGRDEDQTIGRYIGRLLAERYHYDNWANRKNWIDVTIASDQSGGVWRSSVVIHAGDGDGGGVEFEVRQSDGLVLANSFRCLEVKS
jgi:hypothetical protein